MNSDNSDHSDHCMRTNDIASGKVVLDRETLSQINLMSVLSYLLCVKTLDKICTKHVAATLYRNNNKVITIY